MTENPFHPLIRCHIPDCDTLCDLKIRKLVSTGCQMSGHLPGWLSKFIRIGNITDGLQTPSGNGNSSESEPLRTGLQTPSGNSDPKINLQVEIFYTG
ncbi:MAG: hypothetical protein DRI57_23160 [Deltaproteobacteria bacterium]|nr:MAG: hypothetical protein DRI57_23160 [Deltaproteobacteria bacterium]